jgi:hypothetical protein
MFSPPPPMPISEPDSPEPEGDDESDSSEPGSPEPEGGDESDSSEPDSPEPEGGDESDSSEPNEAPSDSPVFISQRRPDTPDSGLNTPKPLDPDPYERIKEHIEDFNWGDVEIIDWECFEQDLDCIEKIDFENYGFLIVTNF